MDGPHGTKLTKKPHSLDQPGGARLLLVQQGIFNWAYPFNSKNTNSLTRQLQQKDQTPSHMTNIKSWPRQQSAIKCVNSTNPTSSPPATQKDVTQFSSATHRLSDSGLCVHWSAFTPAERNSYPSRQKLNTRIHRCTHTHSWTEKVYRTHITINSNSPPTDKLWLI